MMLHPQSLLPRDGIPLGHGHYDVVKIEAKPVVENNCFCSNTTGKKYIGKSREAVITCPTKNVIYLEFIIPYVGETSQALRSRMNNHRQRLNQMCDLFLYQHFCANNHSKDDIAIMPIEEVSLQEGECLRLASKGRSSYKELATINPYGLKL